MKKVNFYFHDTKYNLREREALRNAIEQLFKKEKARLKKINYIFCSDKYLIKINRSFLNHDYFTDIITFDLSDSNDRIEAEVYISIDRVRDNARILKTGLKTELLRVVFHGALHLCGYSDKKQAEKAAMRKKEDEYLTYYFK